MKKRTRKKLHLEEFQVLGFQLEASGKTRNDDEIDELTNRLLDELEELDMSCTGTVDAEHIDLFVVTGRANSGEEYRKQAVVDFLSKFPGIDKVEAGDLVDAFYGPY